MDVILPKRPRINPVSPVEVRLTAREDQLCTLLDEFCASLNSQKPEMDPVMCRIAGGWVRDKLLGMDSDDIDIAINTMTGEAFAQGLLDSGKIESAGATIASNPEQSKHLATTKIKLLDYEVDLVNLRSESYTEDSRIPEIASFLLTCCIPLLIIATTGIWNTSRGRREERSDDQCHVLQCPLPSN
ncbi:CCA tRNA nucleotidyltransferase, mitochondrial [Serendipita sp. 397]|nr:CCA tRNA nucleotidyltransferase, mitochondrial [Serendipita sp. 397]